jgi:hypothetical protein
MVTVTLFAAGCIRIITQEGLTVNPSHIVGLFPGVTVPAIYRIEIISMWKTFIVCIHMAGYTTVAMMDRAGKNGGIHKHGYGSAIEHPGHFPVFMTHHAILISLCIYIAGERTDYKE